MAKKRTPAQDEIFQRVLKDLEKDLDKHHALVDLYDKRYRAYRGLFEPRSQAADYTNKQHPALIQDAVETMVAGLLDPSPTWRLKASPLIGDAAEIQALEQGVRANELLLGHQLVVDKYAEKQRPFDLQGLILGTTGSKQYWHERKGPRRQLTLTHEPVYGQHGNVIGTSPRYVEDHSQEVSYRDDPTSEVLDMRDLILPENAVSLARSPRVQHRFWLTYDELAQLEKDGAYGADAGGESVDLLKGGEGFTGDAYNREQDLFGVKRTKDLIEIVECWTDFGDRVVTIANRAVLLSDKPNPFWLDHLDHRYPFVICSGMPDLFRIPGISEVELMAELQEMLWTLINQRLDSLQLMANAIFLIADDVEDPDSFEFAPGERWLVPRPVDETVKAWTPDTNIPQMTLQAEEILRSDIQNISAGVMSGFQSGNVSRSTATAMSIVTELAQKRIAAKKQQYVWAKGRIAEQWCAMNQQFIRSPRLVPVIGKEGAQAFETIRPEMIQGVYSFSAEMVEESTMRQEKRAEAQSKLQTILNAAPIFAPLASAGLAPMLNLKAAMDDYLKAFDTPDVERYYTAMKPPPQAAQPQPGQPQGAPAQNGQSGGVTNPGLAAGPSSPSNEASQSAAQFMQRMLAQQGGPNNAS